MYLKQKTASYVYANASNMTSSFTKGSRTVLCHLQESVLIRDSVRARFWQKNPKQNQTMPLNSKAKQRTGLLLDRNARLALQSINADSCDSESVVDSRSKVVNYDVEWRQAFNSTLSFGFYFARDVITASEQNGVRCGTWGDKQYQNVWRSNAAEISYSGRAKISVSMFSASFGWSEDGFPT